jgi:hypothetical protein
MSEEKCVKCGKAHAYKRFMLELSPEMDTATIQHDDYRTEIIAGAFEALSQMPPALALSAMVNGEMPRKLSEDDLRRIMGAEGPPVADKDLN